MQVDTVEAGRTQSYILSANSKDRRRLEDHQRRRDQAQQQPDTLKRTGCGKFPAVGDKTIAYLQTGRVQTQPGRGVLRAVFGITHNGIVQNIGQMNSQLVTTSSDRHQLHPSPIFTDGSIERDRLSPVCIQKIAMMLIGFAGNGAAESAETPRLQAAASQPRPSISS